MEPTRVHETIHTLRQKPLHVRENIALGVSGGITLVVALGWLAATTMSGTFRLAPGTLADAQTSEAKQAVAQGKSNFSDLLGAAGAALGATSSPATITVVDTQVRSTLDQPSVPEDATVIHF